MYLKLQHAYLVSVNQTLPQLAVKGSGFPVKFNHCFARIALDTLFKSCWYNHLDRRKTAYKQLNEAQLVAILDILKEMQDPVKCQLYNKLSITYRNAQK